MNNYTDIERIRKRQNIDNVNSVNVSEKKKRKLNNKNCNNIVSNGKISEKNIDENPEKNSKLSKRRSLEKKKTKIKEYCDNSLKKPNIESMEIKIIPKSKTIGTKISTEKIKSNKKSAIIHEKVKKIKMVENKSKNVMVQSDSSIKDRIEKEYDNIIKQLNENYDIEVENDNIEVENDDINVENNDMNDENEPKDCDVPFLENNCDETYDNSDTEDLVAEHEYEKLLSLNPINNINCKILESDGCKHEVCYLESKEYTPLEPLLSKPAKTYKFVLDPFQNRAIQCIENNQSVLVSAHTSAGKTVSALYAIAQCLRKNQRVIYTTPIKALSNQKYDEFNEEFNGDVGLMTGDVTINTDANIMIMTTEILRLMLYNQSSLMRETGWIIFDEIHYMRDPSRGYVWEESIIHLHENHRMLFLSATIPNARQFAQWITYIHEKPCNVIYTDYRPTPLQHLVYINNNVSVEKYQPAPESLFIVKEGEDFYSSKFDNSMLQMNLAYTNPDNIKKKFNDERAEPLKQLVEIVSSEKNLPVIIFAFSKKHCRDYAKHLAQEEFLSYEDIDKVNVEIEKAFTTLSEENKNLPEVKEMCHFLRNGVGVHHSGLLPVMKELVEIIFGKKILKILIATETFAMGLNMPAKSVVFTHIMKFDGSKQRMLSPGEYIQMAGRAGRRGLDKQGLVYTMLPKSINAVEFKRVIQSKTEKLNSSFHLTYNMILKMYRSESTTPLDVMSKSFLQFQAYSNLPSLYEQLTFNKSQIDEILSLQQIEMLESYQALEREYEHHYRLYSSNVREQCTEHWKEAVHQGCAINVIVDDKDFGFCRIVSEVKEDDINRTALKCIIPINEESKLGKSIEEVVPPTRTEATYFKILSVPYKYLYAVCSGFEKTKSIEEYNNKPELMSEIFNVNHLHEKIYMKLHGKMLSRSVRPVTIGVDFRKMQLKLQQHDLFINNELRQELKQKYYERIDSIHKVKDLTKSINQAYNLIHMNDLKNRENILIKLNYMSAILTVQLKGLVACEISTGDVLVLTEMIFNNDFKDMTFDEIAGFMSVFVFEEKVAQKNKLAKVFRKKLLLLKRVVCHLTAVNKSCGMNHPIYSVEKAYMSEFQTGLIEIVQMWSLGGNFAQLAKQEEVMSGSIIRSLRRLGELLAEMVRAFQVLGNENYAQLFKKAHDSICRDMVFSPSLYCIDYKEIEAREQLEKEVKKKEIEEGGDGSIQHFFRLYKQGHFK